MTFSIKPLDALTSHWQKQDTLIFFTCDDRINKCAKRVKDLAVKVVNPVDLTQEIEK